MFTVTVRLKDVGQFNNFTEAFKAFYDETLPIKSAQIIDTACWITHCAGGREFLMGFDSVRDKAYEWGLLTAEGEVVENPPSLPEHRVILRAFIDTHIRDAFAYAKLMR